MLYSDPMTATDFQKFIAAQYNTLTPSLPILSDEKNEALVEELYALTDSYMESGAEAVTGSNPWEDLQRILKNPTDNAKYIRVFGAPKEM